TAHATIFAIGNEVWPAVQAAEQLAKEDDINVTVINARFIKPLDDELIQKYCKSYPPVFTVEEGSLAGGFGAAVMERCEELGIQGVQFHRIGIPDEYVHHGSQDVLRAQYDLHPEGIAKRVREVVRPAGKQGTLGEFVDYVLELANSIPDEDLERMHAKGADSDHIDEVVYGTRKRVAK
ncbi:MAG: hypothetical protein JOZ54_12835, partial [Acidobacteria bacterium]|nr:hypothetical protein [Acidobacteriota bacterium]